MDRLSALDAAFLYLETDSQPLNVGALLVFEGPAPAAGDFRAHVAACLATEPLHRRRVLRIPLDLGRPVWVHSDRFAIDDHLHHAVLEADAAASLRRVVAQFVGHRLPVDRPPWAICLLDGLGGGRWAVIVSAHHALVDGVSGTGLVESLVSSDRAARTPATSRTDRAAAPSRLFLASSAAVWALTLPFRIARLLGRVVRSPRESIRAVQRVRRGVAQVVRPDLPPNVLNGPLGQPRLWGWTRCSLADVRVITSSTGCTVNDVFLAALAGGYRSYLLARGDPLDRLVLRSIVPVSRRSPGGPVRPGNRVSAMFVELPVATDRPGERLAIVARRMADQKSHAVSASTDAVVSLADHVPAPILARAARAYAKAGQRRVNVAATNVPGPPQTRYLMGRRLLEMVPCVPLAQEVRTSVAATSYAGQLTIGVTGDGSALPDLDRLVDAIAAALLDLFAAYRPR